VEWGEAQKAQEGRDHNCHVVVQQKPKQNCKAVVYQLKNKQIKKKKKRKLSRNAG